MKSYPTKKMFGGQEYVTVKLAAKLLDVHPNTIRNWYWGGKMAYHKHGPNVKSPVYIPMSEINAYLPDVSAAE